MTCGTDTEGSKELCTTTDCGGTRMHALDYFLQNLEPELYMMDEASSKCPEMLNISFLLELLLSPHNRHNRGLIEEAFNTPVESDNPCACMAALGLPPSSPHPPQATASSSNPPPVTISSSHPLQATTSSSNPPPVTLPPQATASSLNPPPATTSSSNPSHATTPSSNPPPVTTASSNPPPVNTSSNPTATTSLSIPPQITVSSSSPLSATTSSSNPPQSTVSSSTPPKPTTPRIIPTTSSFRSVDIRYPEGKKLNIAPPTPSNPKPDNSHPTTTPSNKTHARPTLLPTPLMSIQLPLLSTPRNTSYPNHPTPLHGPAPAYQLWWCPSPNCGRANQPDKWYCGYCRVARATDQRKLSRGR